MVKENTKSTLTTWLWNNPARFTGWMLIVSAIFVGISYIPSIMNIPLIDVVGLVLMALSIIFITRNLVKHLPYKNISHSDFVAILNGYKLLSMVLFTGWAGLGLLMNKTTIFKGPITDATTGEIVKYVHISETLNNIIQIIWFVLAVYLLGIWISSIYVKYKRAKDMGISGWKIILSMPFTFMMSWMPGYLDTDKKTQSNMTIKSNWYDKFNKWVIANKNNTLFTFLLLYIFINLFLSANISVILFPLMLFAIYMLWKNIAKDNFKKHINNGYAWLSVGINIFMIIMFIRQIMPYIQIIFHGAIR